MGTNAEGDYSEAIAEFFTINSWNNGLHFGILCRFYYTGVEQEGLMFTDGGEAQAMVYASDEAGIEASALTEVDDFISRTIPTYGFAASPSMLRRLHHDNQDAMASLDGVDIRHVTIGFCLYRSI